MVNVEPIDSTTQQTISDDQELAKVLAGVGQQADEAAEAGAGTIMTPAEEPIVTTPAPALPADDPLPEPVAEEPAYVAPVTPSVAPEPTYTPVTSVASDDLSAVKQDALNELRPLVDKLDVNPEEKFDTYLLLLRSTDDRNLIAPAHEAAKAIVDEARRAQALLDIIKEIDFLTQNQQTS